MTHSCDGRLPYDGHGDAIDNCYELPDGTIWVGNGEYASRVNFCPYCGHKASVQMTLKKREETDYSFHEWS